MDLAANIRTILAEHGLIPVDELDGTVRRIMLAILEDKQSGGW